MISAPSSCGAPRILRSSAVATACAVGIALTAVGSASGSQGHERTASLYPNPVAPRHGATVAFPGRFMCPSPDGLQAVPSNPKSGAAQVIVSINMAGGVIKAEAFADKAGWPLINDMYRRGSSHVTTDLNGEYVDVVSATTVGPYRVPYQRACGKALLRDSVTVIWCAPRGKVLPVKTCLRRYNDLTTYDYVLRRDGHWLFWGLQGGA